TPIPLRSVSPRDAGESEDYQEAAGEALPPSKPLTGPAPPRRSVCAPGRVADVINEQTTFSKEKSMWFHSASNFVKSCSSRISPRPAKVRQRPRSFRPRFEILEDRTLLSGGPSFADPIDYTVGASPRSVTTGDFRGIGILDLAVANLGSNNVSIFLANG